MRWWSVVLIGLALAWSTTAWSQGESRVALVVGNGAYQNAEALRNPVNDARAMAEVLRDAGFDVILRENATRRGLLEGLREFSAKLTPGGVGLFYYAGHGMQVRGLNYLIPVDAALSNEDEVKYETLDVNDVLSRLDEARARLSLVILDACRDNPFARRFRSTSRGLAQTDAPRGTVIAYATAPGETAADGDGANGLYTTELLKAIVMPGLKLEEVFKRTIDGVARASGNKQTPWVSSSFRGEFYFHAAAAAQPPGSPAATPAPPGAPAFDDRQLELAMWQSADKSGQAGDYNEYLKKYPNGQFAGMARNRLAALKNKPAPGGQGTPVATPVAPGPSTALRRDVPVATRWVDNWGAVYSMTQSGDRYHFTASGQGCRGSYTSQGTSVVTGQRVEVSYRTAYAVGISTVGTCTGTISADGNRITSNCRDSVCGSFRTVIDRR
ncbi:MAG: caspase family protein [Alphaproteobacteria bacterium]|nr:caspase family protein [Alphaproteobacteria bacterium]MCW5739902.1 caspase family protein [Alphaproteobacteria bacterium]